MSDYVIRVENLGKKYRMRHGQPTRISRCDLIANGM